MSDDAGGVGADGESERGPARYADGRFGPGNPGRPPGVRNKLSQRLVTSILADFERHRESVLARLRDEHTTAYARLVARLLPAGEGARVADELEAPFGARFAALGPAALAEALARLSEAPAGDGWRQLVGAEQFLLRETRRARLAEELAAALGAAAGGGNGENTAPDARGEGAEAGEQP